MFHLILEDPKYKIKNLGDRTGTIKGMKKTLIIFSKEVNSYNWENNMNIYRLIIPYKCHYKFRVINNPFRMCSGRIYYKNIIVLVFLLKIIT